MRLFVVMAHYDPGGQVAPHVRRNVAALARIAERLVFVTTAPLIEADAAWVSERAELVRRDNFGYDFFSYRAGLLETGGLTDYDQVLISNDTFVGPLVDYAEIFTAMADRPFDFWGLTKSDRVKPHVQSFFVCFRGWVVRSHAFQHFWHRMIPLSNRSQVIHRYEVGLTRTLEQAGFAWGSYYNESPADARMARRRMMWRAWCLSQRVPLRQRRARFHALAREPWNPNAALADRALGPATLPIVKIDTLRYDPYGLDAERLLRAGLASHPEEFAEVPAYLARTAPFYPDRPNERLPDPGVFRPMFPLVRYS
ncbi:MAG: rhamnan synthesis F family protein [Jatrophihabitantaceae bacterium]